MTETALPSPSRVSLPHLALGLPWIAIVVAAFAPITDNSFLWHITAGDIQSRAGGVIVADPFSFTMHGERWLTPSWLTELLYDAGHSAFGIGFVGPMMVLAGVAFFAGLGLLVFRSSNSVPATSLMILLTTILVTPFLVPRPVLFSYPLFVLVLLAWGRPNTRWAVPLLMWIWASMHGSFVIGLVVLGLMVLANRDWRSIPHLVASGVATLLTAHGLGVLIVLVDFANAKPYLDLLAEWRTPSFVSPTMTPVVIGIVLLLYGAMRQRLSPRDLVVIAPLLLLAMSASRAVVTAWLGLAPYVASSISGLERKWGR